jgi:hypothetical protein
MMGHKVMEELSHCYRQSGLLSAQSVRHVVEA